MSSSETRSCSKPAPPRRRRCGSLCRRSRSWRQWRARRTPRSGARQTPSTSMFGGIADIGWSGRWASHAEQAMAPATRNVARMARTTRRVWRTGTRPHWARSPHPCRGRPPSRHPAPTAKPRPRAAAGRPWVRRALPAPGVAWPLRPRPQVRGPRRRGPAPRVRAARRSARRSSGVSLHRARLPGRRAQWCSQQGRRGRAQHRRWELSGSRGRRRHREHLDRHYLPRRLRRCSSGRARSRLPRRSRARSGPLHQGRRCPRRWTCSSMPQSRTRRRTRMQRSARWRRYTHRGQCRKSWATIGARPNGLQRPTS
mmetsp:Transcript_102629/g.296724  ORF Transcript_102629/g.296724 Transcript_102629/m.296724 type:complete len:312 (+) Transcript_102629:1001-1936(+)